MTVTSAPDGDVLQRCRGESNGDSRTRGLRLNSVGDTPSNLVSQRTDTQLLLELTNGSNDALVELYARHGASMNALARRLRGSKDADDVVQDVFFRLWHALPSTPTCFSEQKPSGGPLAQLWRPPA